LVEMQVVAKAAEACPIMKAARDAAVTAEAANGGRVPPVPGAVKVAMPGRRQGWCCSHLRTCWA
jgi:hypothetical protein